MKEVMAMVVRIVLWVALLAIGAVVAASFRDIARYLRIRRM